MNYFVTNGFKNDRQSLPLCCHFIFCSSTTFKMHYSLLALHVLGSFFQFIGCHVGLEKKEQRVQQEQYELAERKNRRHTKLLFSYPHRSQTELMKFGYEKNIGNHPKIQQVRIEGKRKNTTKATNRVYFVEISVA